MHIPRGHNQRRQAFTLMEMLTAVAVLSILSVMIFQIINSVSIATRQSSKRVDLYQEAAFVLDRITTDLQARSRRADQPFVISGTYLEFYTNAPAFYPSTGNTRNKLSKVAYQISNSDPNNPSNTLPQLQRAVVGTYWDNSGIQAAFNPQLVLVTGAIPATQSNFANDDWQTLSKNVICFKISYLLKDNKETSPANTNTIDPNNPLPQNPGTRNISALIVTLALLDDNTLKILGTSGITPLATTLSSTSPDEQGNQINTWNPLIGNQTPLIRQNLRFSQRLIPLN